MIAAFPPLYYEEREKKEKRKIFAKKLNPFKILLASHIPKSALSSDIVALEVMLVREYPANVWNFHLVLIPT